MGLELEKHLNKGERSIPFSPTRFFCIFKTFYNEILGANVCKIKKGNNLKENWPRKGKINKVVNREEIIHNFKKLKTKGKTRTTIFLVYQ